MDEVFYQEMGSGLNIILLHGWGSDSTIFNDFAKHLCIEYKVWLIDLPGFGKSKIPDRPYKVLDYMALLREFILINKIDDPIIMGHSFGGRIAIKYASLYDVNKLVLIDSAGIRRWSFKTFMKIRLYKIFKFLRIKNSLGSTDYKNSIPVMKMTLSLVVNEDLRKDMKYIKANTLIIWGENDQVTKKEDGYLMNEIISNSGIVLVPNAKHFPFLENRNYFYLAIDSFLASDNK